MKNLPRVHNNNKHLLVPSSCFNCHSSKYKTNFAQSYQGSQVQALLNVGKKYKSQVSTDLDTWIVIYVH